MSTYSPLSHIHLLISRASYINDKRFIFAYNEQTGDLALTRNWKHFRCIKNLCVSRWIKHHPDFVRVVDTAETIRKIMNFIHNLIENYKQTLFYELTSPSKRQIKDFFASPLFNELCLLRNQHDDIYLTSQQLRTFDPLMIRKLVSLTHKLRRGLQKHQLDTSVVPPLERLIPLEIIKQPWAAKTIQRRWRTRRDLRRLSGRPLACYEQLIRSTEHILVTFLNLDQAHIIVQHVARKVRHLVEETVLLRPTTTIRFSRNDHLFFTNQDASTSPYLPCSGHVTMMTSSNTLLVKFTSNQSTGEGRRKIVYKAHTFSGPLFPCDHCDFSYKPTVLARSRLCTTNNNTRHPTYKTMLQGLWHHQEIYQLPSPTRIKLAKPPRIETLRLFRGMPLLETSQPLYGIDLFYAIQIGSIPAKEKPHPLTLKRALEIIIDVASTVEHFHRYHKIHGDVRPPNIFVYHVGALLNDLDVVSYPRITAPHEQLNYYSDLASFKGWLTSARDCWSLVVILGETVFRNTNFLDLVKNRELLIGKDFDDLVTKFLYRHLLKILRESSLLYSIPIINPSTNEVISLTHFEQLVKDLLIAPKIVSPEIAKSLQNFLKEIRAIKQIQHLIRKAVRQDMLLIHNFSIHPNTPLRSTLERISSRRNNKKLFETTKQEVDKIFMSATQIRKECEKILHQLVTNDIIIPCSPF